MKKVSWLIFLGSVILSANIVCAESATEEGINLETETIDNFSNNFTDEADYGYELDIENETEVESELLSGIELQMDSEIEIDTNEEQNSQSTDKDGTDIYEWEEQELIIGEPVTEIDADKFFEEKMAELIGLDAISEIGQYDVTGFGANGKDKLDDTAAFVQALAMAKTAAKPITVQVPAGTYYINRAIPIYSNTSLALDENAIMISTEPEGAMIYARHLKSDGTVCEGGESCTHGGYSQIQNVTIRGGVWDRNDVNGRGNNAIFTLTHGYNITIKDLTCKHCTNHYFNLSGVDTAIIHNVKFLDQVEYKGNGTEFWADHEIGDPKRYTSIEAVHLDYTDAEGEAESRPLDNTPSRNITVTNCLFENVFAGVGTHHTTEHEHAKTITIINNHFRNLKGNCINAYSFDTLNVTENTGENVQILLHAVGSHGGTIINNQVNTAATGIAIDGQSTGYIVEKNTIVNTVENGIYVYDRSSAVITNNKVVNTGTAGIRANQKCQITAQENTIESSGTHGISAANGTTLIANNNVVTNPGSNGIYLNSFCNSSSVTNNEISGAKDAGIMIYTDCTDGKVDGNTINGASTGIGITEKSTGWIVKKNVIMNTKENGIYIYNGSTATITENNITKPGTAGIRVNLGCEVTVQKNTIKASGIHGISAANRTTLTADNNIVTDPGSNGIYLNVSCSDGSVTNNHITAAKDGGIVLSSGCTNDKITGNTIDTAATGIGITDNSTGNTVKSNIVKNTVENGIYLNNGSTATLTDNNITKPGTAGIRANQNCQVTASGNTITSPGTHGFSVANGSVLTASKNTVKSPKEIGIYLNSCKSGNKLDSNTVESSGSAGIYVYCTPGCAITNNTVKNSGGHAIQAAGTASVKCTVTIKGNTAATKSKTDRDIRLSDYCANCVVQNNWVGERGFTAADTSTYTASNNKEQHQHVWKDVIDKAATCLEAGSKHRECTVCGVKEPATAIAKLKPTIKVSMTSVLLQVKQSYTIKVSNLAKGDSVKSWKSSNKKIASVSKKGKITGKKTGKATVTVTLASGLTQKIAVQVQKGSVKTTKITLNCTKKTLQRNQSFALKATLTPLTSQQKIKYSSSNIKIATVSSTGVVKGKKAGTVTITVQSGGKKAKCKVTIK